MGMADIAEVLWLDYLKHNPENPGWANRDRFVLSNGHGSMLLYSLLHLTGYELSLSELKNFRQLGSKTPGHPEYGYAPGVETTTGPLGQGLANGVGMALAEKILAARFNRPGFDVVDHHTYVFAGDGCLMEGISHEACSLAGTLRLGKLICVYDDNGISIDGEIDGWFTDDTVKRFEAYGWHVVPAVDGHDPDAVNAALAAAKADDRPSLVCCKTQIGFGAPTKAGTAASHGSPLGAEEIEGARAALGWTHAPFTIPDEIYSDWSCREKGAASENTWRQSFAEYASAHPELAAEFERRMSGKLPDNWETHMQHLLDRVASEETTQPSRKSSGAVIADFSKLLPELIGGSADLSGSNNTQAPHAKTVTADDGDGNYIHYGVREFGMTAITNGMALHGGLIPFSGTFLMFMEYARNAVRMSALMGIRNVLVYTHDSIGQGEDGPTHQPVEQLAALRATPNLSVWRPCDTVETLLAWKSAVERTDGPTAIVLTRQDIAYQARDSKTLENASRGAYVIHDCEGTPDAIVIATGSEVGIAIESAKQLAGKGHGVRVVSMPSADVFEAQEADYIETVLPSAVRTRVAVEAAHVDYWRKWVGLDGSVVGMTTFGESGPGGQVMDHFGFTPERVSEAVAEVMGRAKA